MENNDRSGASFLMSLLDKIDSWKKLGIFITLVFFSLSGYFIYTYQKDILFFALSTFGRPEINTKKLIVR